MRMVEPNESGGGVEREDPVFDGALRALRAEVPIRAPWREDLLAKLEGVSPAIATDEGSAVRAPRASARRWSLRPTVAIAAAAGFVLLGVGIANVAGVRARGVSAAAQRGAATEPAAVVRFVLVADGAQRVSLVGDFNGWNAATLPLSKGADGRSWTIDIRLAPGRYAYAFSVDGQLIADPSAPRSADEDFGVPTSVALVAERRS